MAGGVYGAWFNPHRDPSRTSCHFNAHHLESGGRRPVAGTR